MNTKKQNNKVAIIMGSQSDYSVRKECEKILKLLKVKYQTLIVSAHRTPRRMFQFDREHKLPMRLKNQCQLKDLRLSFGLGWAEMKMVQSKIHAPVMAKVG